MSDRDGRVERTAGTLLPIMGLVFVAFLVIGLAMPVLPLHVHLGLGLDTFVVGLVAGSQFAVSLLSRPWAGDLADRRGPRRAVVTGLLLASASGVVYLLSLQLVAAPPISAVVLVLGRLLLGAAESAIITGSVIWGMVLAGPRNTGRVIAWVGAAMFAAFAIGAPMGSVLYDAFGFFAICLATIAAPLLTLPLVALQPFVPASLQARPSFLRVLRSVWLPGLGAGLSSVGFGAIIAFVTLLFANRGWSHGWLPYSVFAGAFILARLLFGHLPDRLGGARVALVCLLIEAVGLALIWMAPQPGMALLGAGLTGLGYSLVYPGFGVEAVRREPAENRGLAMGAYTAFLDLALGLGGPGLGLIADDTGVGFLFLLSAGLVVAAVPIALGYLWQGGSGEGEGTRDPGGSARHRLVRPGRERIHAGP